MFFVVILAHENNCFNRNMWGKISLYRAFQIFGQAKFPDGGSVLASSQYSILPHMQILPDTNVVKIDP